MKLRCAECGTPVAASKMVATMREFVKQLAQAIYRKSPMIADNIGVPLTLEELDYIYQAVGRVFMTDPYIQTLEDIVDYPHETPLR